MYSCRKCREETASVSLDAIVLRQFRGWKSVKGAHVRSQKKFDCRLDVISARFHIPPTFKLVMRVACSNDMQGNKLVPKWYALAPSHFCAAKQQNLSTTCLFNRQLIPKILNIWGKFEKRRPPEQAPLYNYLTKPGSRHTHAIFVYLPRVAGRSRFSCLVGLFETSLFRLSLNSSNKVIGGSQSISSPATQRWHKSLHLIPRYVLYMYSVRR